MAIKTINITTLDNVKKTDTSNWSTASSNSRISINDKISPNLNITKIVDTTTMQVPSTADKVNTKITGTTKATLDNLKKDINLTTLTISNNTNEILKNNIVNKIVKQLTSPGLPINLKNTLSKAINTICTEMGKVQLDMDISLKILLDGYNLEVLMSLVSCLSDQTKLGATVLSLLNGSLSTNNVVKGLNSTLKTGKVSINVVADIMNDDKGKVLINTNKDVLDNIDKNTNIKGNIHKDLADNLFEILPTDNISMGIYSKNNKMYSKIVDKKNSTKNKTKLNMVISKIDKSTKNKLFMLNYNEETNKPIIM
jgi:hypothetical protein